MHVRVIGQTSPRTYAIDAKELEQAFFKLQKTLHPDHYGQKSQVCMCVCAKH
jgi:hypothetical protein